MAILILVALAHMAGAMTPAGTDSKVRLEKRGPKAWLNFAKQPPLMIHERGTTRLLAHVVADRTFKQWDPRLRAFIAEAQRLGAPLDTPAHLDQALAEHMDFLCYGQELQPAAGSALLHGVLLLCPELRGKLPLAARALQSWGRLSTVPEGSPACEEAVMLVAEHMLRQGLIFPAIWTLAQYDLFAREQDIEGLYPGDIVVDNGQMAVVFGVGQRGQSCKTGRDQGCVVERPWIARALAALVAMTPPGARVFPLTQDHYRRHWTRAFQALGLPHRPPHALRHTAAAEAIAQGRLGLEQVRRRGRWKALSSVQRYTKVHDIIIYKSGMPTSALRHGRDILEDPAAAMLRALGSGSTPLHQALRSALAAPDLPRLQTVQGPCGGGNLAARTVPELKQLCKDAGLPLTGKKLDLIRRLSEAKPNNATVDASPVEKLAEDDNWCESHWDWGHSHH